MRSYLPRISREIKPVIYYLWQTSYPDQRALLVVRRPSTVAYRFSTIIFSYLFTKCRSVLKVPVGGGGGGQDLEAVLASRLYVDICWCVAPFIFPPQICI
jgi:hypothetical protein